jgi:DNA-binding response OmpR family regulator
VDPQNYVNQKRFIVVQEDDDLIRQLLERWLGEAGYTTLLAEKARHALPPGESPRLVIANVASPRGADPLIQALKAVYAAPILVLSARFRHGLGASVDTARRLGVRNVLPKPFTRKELLAAVEASLEREP